MEHAASPNVASEPELQEASPRAERRLEPQDEAAPSTEAPTDTQRALKRVFIVGFPRSGTTFTMWLMAQLPTVVALQQSGLFHALEDLERWWRHDHAFSSGPRHEAPPADGELGPGHPGHAHRTPWRAGARTFVGSTAVLSEEAYFERLRPLCAHVFERIASATPDASVVVEQTPENMEFERTIRHVFPDAYFLEVVRDPRDALCSMRRAALAWDNEFPGRPIHIARRWLKFRRHARTLQAHARHHLQVRYEDLLRDAPGELARIAEWLGERVDPALCAHAADACRFDRMRSNSSMPSAFFHRAQAGGWRETLSSSEQHLVEYLFGEEMERLGYPAEHPRAKHKPWRLGLHERLARVYGPLRHRYLRSTQRLRKALVHRDWELRFRDRGEDGPLDRPTD